MTTKGERSQLSYWAVSFLDILGYRSVLSGMDTFPFPEPGPDLDRVIDAFKRARDLREGLVRNYETFVDSMNSLPFPTSGAGAAARYDIEALRTISILKNYGPDHIVLACSLYPDQTISPLRSVYALVTGSAILALLQLARGADNPRYIAPIRGGIDVGLGVLDAATQELYSPALTKAYELEEQACYPRILVGPAFVDYVQSCVEESSSTVCGRVARGTGSRISNGLVRDSSGPTILDFFGLLCRQGLCDNDAREIGEAVWTYVSRVRREHSGSNNRRVQEKYEWLFEYVRARLPIWGVSE